MPRPRTQERVVLDDHKEYIVLHREQTLKKLNVKSLHNMGMLTYMVSTYVDYISTARRWFWIETGVLLQVLPTEDGFLWAVPSDKDTSSDIKWLRSKALKFEAKLVERINEHFESLSDIMDKIESQDSKED